MSCPRHHALLQQWSLLASHYMLLVLCLADSQNLGRSARRVTLVWARAKSRMPLTRYLPSLHLMSRLWESEWPAHKLVTIEQARCDHLRTGSGAAASWHAVLLGGLTDGLLFATSASSLPPTPCLHCSNSLPCRHRSGSSLQQASCDALQVC